MIDIQHLKNVPENFSVPRSKFCKPEQWFGRKVGKIYGQLTKQYRLGKKEETNKQIIFATIGRFSSATSCFRMCLNSEEAVISSSITPPFSIPRASWHSNVSRK